jgi:hypothetical protein
VSKCTTCEVELDETNTAECYNSDPDYRDQDDAVKGEMCVECFKNMQLERDPGVVDRT